MKTKGPIPPKKHAQTPKKKKRNGAKKKTGLSRKVGHVSNTTNATTGFIWTPNRLLGTRVRPQGEGEGARGAVGGVVPIATKSCHKPQTHKPLSEFINIDF
jgi:hypothetical protein